jgi:hypothetical protein
MIKRVPGKPGFPLAPWEKQMFKLGQSPLEFYPRRAKTLPTEGQRVLITIAKDVVLWQGSSRVCYREGEVYDGTVASVEAEGLIGVYTEEGEYMRIHVRDVAFMLEAVEL